MAYRFKLQVLLEYRRRVEEGLQIELSRILANLENAKQVLFSCQREKAYYEEELARKESKEITLHESIMYRDYLRGIRNKIKLQRERITAIRGELDKKQAELLTATKQRKVMEKLKEKQGKKFLEEVQRKEGMFIDEVAIRRHQGNV